jgi:hypothetical protein
MPDNLTLLLAGLMFVAFMAGVSAERWVVRRARERWRKQNGSNAYSNISQKLVDASDQLRVVMAAKFEKRPLLSRSEAQVMYAAEKAIREQRLDWRVMAQVSLGEVLSSPDPKAYSTINSKRVDLLLVSNGGQPIAAIEFQGGGHYQGSAAARDAVKKEALRRAGVDYLEVKPGQTPGDLARAISQITRPQQTLPDTPATV